MLTHRRDFLRTLAAVFVILGISVSAGILVHAQIDRKVDISRYFSFVGFTLEKSTLEDVTARFGPSNVLRCSREEEADEELCYLTKDGRAKVVFFSGFAGGWKELTGYKVISSSLQRPCYRECPRISLATEALRSGGLRLGLTRQEVIALLGKPKKVENGALLFQWSTQLPWTAEEIENDKTKPTPPEFQHWDVTDTIWVTLAQNRIVEFQVEHIVTY